MNSKLFGAHKDFLTLYFILCVVAYGTLAFNLDLHNDDWVAYWQTGFQYDWVVSLGRWLERFIWLIFDDNYFVPAFSLAFFLLCVWIFSFVTFRALEIEDNTALYIFTLIFAFSPILSEPLTYKIAQLDFAFALLFSAVSFWYIKKASIAPTKKSAILPTVLGALFLSLTVSAYQPLALVVLQLSTVLTMVMLLRKQKAITPIVFALTALLGIAFYLLEIQWSLYFFDITLQEKGPYAIGQTKTYFELFLVHLHHFLFEPQHLMPMVFKYLFLVTFGGLVLLLSFKSRKVLMPLLFVLLLITPFLLSLIAGIMALRYNAMIGLALLYAFSFSLLYLFVENTKLKRLLLAMSALIIFISIFEQNKASTIRLANNQRDLAIAQRMVDRIESNEAFDTFLERRILHLIVVGRTLTHLPHGRPFEEQNSEPFGGSVINVDAFRNGNKVVFKSMFRLLGYSDKIKTYIYNYPRFPKRFKQYGIEEKIKEAKPWPAPSSLIPFEKGYILVLKKGVNG